MLFFTAAFLKISFRIPLSDSLAVGVLDVFGVQPLTLACVIFSSEGGLAPATPVRNQGARGWFASEAALLEAPLSTKQLLGC